MLHVFFDAPVGNEPDKGHDGIDAEGNARVEKRRGNGDDVESEGAFAFPVAPEGTGQFGVFAAMAGEHVGKYGIGDGAHDKHRAVTDDGPFGKMIFAHPAGGKGHQRKPEQQIKVGPQCAAGNRVGQVKHVVVVVPVNAHVHKTERIGKKRRRHGQYGAPIVAVDAGGHFKLEHHNGDDDGKYAVAESLHASFFHAGCSVVVANIIFFVWRTAAGAGR